MERQQNKPNQQTPQLGGLTFIGVNSTLNSLEAELRFEDVEIVGGGEPYPGVRSTGAGVWRAFRLWGWLLADFTHPLVMPKRDVH